MSLATGVRLGPYEITGLLGAGGMGDVYRARDTKLGRDVAIKVLPDAFVADPERAGRFQREAKTLASLNHPNIAAIYGLEDASGVTALVLELVERPTLADRLAAGAMPVDDALPVARQIALAIEAAHEQGVVHRDLKPANVKVQANGTVKVLDFGLAKLAADTSGQARSSSGAGAAPTQSPTVTSPVATMAGVILGTAAYMSPEQARGKPVDKRADIWAFGCVLFEMLTGTRAFGGDEVSDTLAFIITRPVDWSALPAATSPAIRRLLRRCLEKDPNKRLRDMWDARIELDEALALGEDAVTGSAPVPAGRPASRQRAALAATALASGAMVGAATWSWMRPPAASVPPPVRFAIVTPAAQQMSISGTDRDLAISPDGTKVVYIVNTGAQRQLLLRDLDRLEVVPVGGVSNPRTPFFSPDGKWIGYFESDELKKVSIAGGSPVSLCRAAPPRGAVWGSDDRIILAGASPTEGLRAVRATGGEPDSLTRPDASRGEISFAPAGWPGRPVCEVGWRSGPGADCGARFEHRDDENPD